MSSRNHDSRSSEITEVLDAPDIPGRVAPGKQSLTGSGARGGVSSARAPGTIQRVADPDAASRAAAITASWTDAAFRPDLFGAPVQRQSAGAGGTTPAPADHGGLPASIQAGVENLSGMAMDDVRVHYNSSKPAEVQALAYTQGTDIHVAPGQESHLAHEAWHVVQQKQGRVAPTVQMKGVGINDDDALEREADVMGARALQQTPDPDRVVPGLQASVSAPTVQRVGDKLAVGYHEVEEGTVREIQEGIRAIYERHKQEKKARRDQLDQDYQLQSANLEDKQSYLMIALEKGIMECFQGDAEVGQNFAAQISTLDTKLGQSTLLQPDKNTLDQEAARLAPGLAATVKQKMAERALDPTKKNNKQAWRSKISEYARDFGRHAVADPIVQGYEQGYKDSGMSKDRLLTDWVAFAASKDYDLQLVTEDDIGVISINPRDQPEQDIEIATVYFNDARFVKTSEIVLGAGTGNEEVREIFAHRESGEEYVQDAFDRYVRRYVHRALNKYDNPGAQQGVSINVDPRTKTNVDPPQPWSQIAAQVPSMTRDEQYQEIRNHQRAKELQGGSPFISFGATDRPIFGSSAKPFEGEHGVATVDLAQISKNQVFDTHTPEALEEIHGIEDPDPHMPFVEGSDEVERNSAARDAMRTREVVVAGDIPNQAITAVKQQGVEYMRSMDGKLKPPQQVLQELIAQLPLWLSQLSIPPANTPPAVDDVD